jgi:hypothetical protein
MVLVAAVTALNLPLLLPQSTLPWLLLPPAADMPKLPRLLLLLRAASPDALLPLLPPDTA